jgi:hypothetical protein
MRALAMGSRLGGVALASLLILAPPPASARGGWHGDRGHHHGHGDHPDRHHEHGEWCAPRHSHVDHYYEPVPAWGWYAPRPVVHARYRCEPCGYWYDEEASFHRHIHRHHHIAQALVPMMIGAAAFGWIFYGH